MSGYVGHIHDPYVYDPDHYTQGGERMETYDAALIVCEGLPHCYAIPLFNVLKYFDRRGLKDDETKDLAKANNYAHRAFLGEWRHED